LGKPVMDGSQYSFFASLQFYNALLLLGKIPLSRSENEEIGRAMG